MILEEQTHFRKHSILKILCLTALLLMVSAAAAFAEGWVTTGNQVSYTLSNGKKAEGLTQINGKTYYFQKGALKTGWVKTKDGVRYFAVKGTAGNLGRMLTGLQTISGKKFFFSAKTGILQTGMQKVGKYVYYFAETDTLGTHGAAAVKKFIVYQGGTYYFSAKGRMVKNKWAKGSYLGADGKKLVSTVTPDSYLVDAQGKKVKKVKTGLVEINGKTYYWNKKKAAFLKNTTYKVGKVTYVFDANGVGTVKNTADAGSSNKRPRILIVAGHGQGDGGATSSLGQESVKTREFARLIYQQLLASGKVDVTFYKDGSASYDMYQQNVATLGSTGANLASKITGKGKIKKKVIKAMKKNANLPVLTNYDYVLEVHFNATAANAKDISGNKAYKGFGFYLNQYKTKTNLEKNICASIAKLGFKIWGGSARGNGVNLSGTLFNARICQELGVSYALVETAFIDDKDDMTFYKKHKKAMAAAIATNIVAYYA